MSTNLNQIARQLSSVLLIDSSRFGRASPTVQTEVMTLAGGGRSVLFVDSFYALKDRKKIRDRLLAGEDVSVELEFNGIELSVEDRRVLGLVLPILRKLETIKDGYSWLSDIPAPGEMKSVKINKTTISSGGYSIGMAAAQKIWYYASRYWATKEAVMVFSVSASGYSRQVEVRENAVRIGCQNVSRRKIEYVARCLGWEPSLG